MIIFFTIYRYIFQYKLSILTCSVSKLGFRIYLKNIKLEDRFTARIMPVISHGVEEFHLSHEEEDKLNNFQSITNFPEEDLSLVIKLLQNHSWNMEAALSRFFDDSWKDSVALLNSASNSFGSATAVDPMAAIVENSQTPIEIPQTETHSPITRPQRDLPFLGSHYVPALPLAKRLPQGYQDKLKIVGLNGKTNIWDIYDLTVSGTNDQLWGSIIVVLLLIPKILARAGLSIVSVLWSVIAFGFTNGNENKEATKIYMIPKYPLVTYFNEFNEKYAQNNSENMKGYLATNIRDGSKVERLQNLLPEGNLTYNELLDDAQSEFKYLLVIILGNLRSFPSAELEGKHIPNGAIDIDVNSEKFLNRIITDDNVLRILEEHKDDMLIYMGSVSDVEPWAVANELKLNYTPDCFLLANVMNSNGSVNGTTRLSVLNKIRMTTPRRFASMLEHTINKYNPELVVSRTDVQELRLARQIKQMQEEAYENSLKQDRLKEEKRRAEEEEQQALKEMELKKEKEAAILKGIDDLMWIRMCALECRDSKYDQIDVDEKLATLQFRTSDGKRFIKKFPGSKDLFSTHCSIGCHLYLDTTDNPTKWLEMIYLKVSQLASDPTSLCFKDDSKLNTEDTTLEEIIDTIDSELKQLNDQLDYDSGTLDFSFELISPFPRFKVPVNKELKIEDVPEIWPKGSLLIEEKIDEEDTEEDESEPSD
ncbi:Ubx2p [Nakaseomyces bracarensis]